jgi:glucose/mannose-6-phosphate isomerase
MEKPEMNLDDPRSFQTEAHRQVLAEIERLPGTLLDGFDAGQRLAIGPIDHLTSVVISGTGNSIAGADLLAGYLAETNALPVVIHRDYDLPAFASGPECLVVLCSASGETQETLSGLEVAAKNHCSILALCSGGGLAQQTLSAGGQLWPIPGQSPLYGAPGYSFGLLLAAFQRLGLIDDPSASLEEAVQAIKTQQAALGTESPVGSNLAKRMAGQLMGRMVTIFASGQLVPVARRWKSQINQIAKSMAQFEALPEADYGALQGASMPEPILLHSMALFLRAASDHRQNRLRSNLTRRALMLEGVNTDFVDAQGSTPLANLWTLAHMGDYIAFYLAAAYGVNPTPAPALDNPKSLN